MSRDDELRIADILEAATELIAVVDRGRPAFDADPILQRAAERLLEIIGEAANGLSEAEQARHDGIPWRDITRLRIVLAHHYHRVDPALVWQIATTEVPALVDTLRSRRS